MRLKKFNEYFDTEDMKFPEEVRFLQGEVKRDMIDRIKEIDQQGENTTNRDLPDYMKSISAKVTWEIPYLAKMTLKSDRKKYLIFFDEIKDESDGNNLESLCAITLTVNKDSTIVPAIDCYIKVNGEEIFSENSDDKLMKIDDLLDLLKSKYLNIVDKWDLYNKSTIDKSFFKSKKSMKFNPRSN